MEAYGFVYDPQATPFLPPVFSVNMPIWGQHLPAATFDGEPKFLSTTPPAPILDPAARLTEAGCLVDPGGWISCPDSSPLAVFGCESISPPEEDFPELGSGP